VMILDFLSFTGLQRECVLRCRAIKVFFPNCSPQISHSWMFFGTVSVGCVVLLVGLS
jgi:hypothetical protein